MTDASRRGPIWLSGLLSLVPLVLLVLLIRQSFVDVPFWDEWDIVVRLQRIHEGSFTLLDLWRQHNEHRPFFGVGLVLLLVRASQWNVAVEIAANVVVGATTFAVVAWQLVSWWPKGRPFPVWLLPAVSVLVFSPSQAENWLWGWQVTIFLNVLAVTAGFAFLASNHDRWSRVVPAMLCGVVATYSFASGLVFWGTGLLALWMGARRRRRVFAAVWIAVALVTVGSYFFDYHANPGHPTIQSNFVSPQAFWLFITYSAKYTGAAIASYDSSYAAVAGWLAGGLFVVLVAANRDLAGSPLWTFVTVTCLHCLAVASMTGLGRTGFGTDQGLASRYITVSTPMWVGVITLAGLRLSQPRSEPSGPTRPGVESWLLWVVLVAAAVSTASTWQWGVRVSHQWRETLAPARRALIEGGDERLLARLYPSAAEVRNRRQLLMAWHLSVFRSARAQRADSTENR